VFTNITVHDTVAVRTGASFAVPIRKGSPLLAAELNEFIAKFGLGTAFGNMMQKRYLVSTKFVKSATSEAERQKFLALTEFFKKYSDQYEMDYLLMGAHGIPGVAAQPGREEPGGRHRRDAGDARHRQGPEPVTSGRPRPTSTPG
jgi:hypothetical protein